MYTKIDIFSKVFDELTEINEEYGIAIIGPKKLNLKKNSIYPLFSAWKINNLDNKYFAPSKKAYILITQIEMKTLDIVCLENKPAKMPLLYESSKPNYPPGYDKNKKIITYDKIWKDISQSEIKWIDGHYSLQVICGKMISNTLNIEVVGAGIKAHEIDVSGLNSHLESHEYEKRNSFEKNKLSRQFRK